MDDRVPSEEMLRCLLDPRRRYTVFYLQQRSNPVPVATLAAEIAAWEADTSAGAVPEDAIERVHIELHHVHLPRLEAAGLIELGAEREQVVPTGGTRIAERLRRRLVDVQDRLVDD